MMQHQLPNRRAILYYPYIDVPSRWLRQTILYWDEIGSIMPQNIPFEQIHGGHELRFLQEEGLYRPFRPGHLEFLSNNDFNQFVKEFLIIYRSDDFQKLLSSQQFSQLHHENDKSAKDLETEVLRKRLYTLHQRPDLNRADYTRIHFEKLPYGRARDLFDYLLEEGVLLKADNPWYFMERRTAFLYISLLAKYLADEDWQSTVSGTDNQAFENLIFGSKTRVSGGECLATQLQNVIPTPRLDVPLQQIINFKRNRRDELLHFRQLLNEFQQDLRNSENESEIKEKIIGFEEKLERGVNELQCVLIDSRVDTIFSSLKTIIKLDSTTLWTTAGVVAGKATKIADLPLEWTVAGIGILGSVEIGTFLVNRKNEEKAKLRESPFSYLYHAKKQRIMPVIR